MFGSPKARAKAKASPSIGGACVIILLLSSLSYSCS